MDNRARQYIHEQLASHGWVLISPRWAAITSPGLYGGGQAALGLLSGSGLELLNAKPYRVLFEDGSDATCWSRSPDSLARRIEWICGVPVYSVTPIMETAQEPPKPMPRAAEREQQARIDRLRKLAAEEPPAHDCRRRDEIMQARHELGVAQ